MGSPIDSATNMNRAVGILNQAITLARLESSKGEAGSPGEDRVEGKSESLKERFENHPLIFCCSLIFASFLLGVGFREFLLKFESQPIAATSSSQPVNVECKVDGVPLLGKSHDERVSSMQRKLMELEGLASDRNILGSYQRTYLESANRVRADIEVENKLFGGAVERLSTKCQEAGYEKGKAKA